VYSLAKTTSTCFSTDLVGRAVFLRLLLTTSPSAPIAIFLAGRLSTTTQTPHARLLAQVPSLLSASASPPTATFLAHKINFTTSTAPAYLPAVPP
jgi:hypothetical protein